MMLTKRPRNAAEMLNGNSMFVVDPNKAEGWKFDCPPNLWLGVTVENQDATHRIPAILKVPSPVHFISVEPMLGPVLLEREWLIGKDRIGWVIAGGETGPRARPANPAWVRFLRNQCLDWEIPFFFKGWGRWVQNPSAAGRRILDGREWSDFPLVAENRLH
jgi:protein gp37